VDRSHVHRDGEQWHAVVQAVMILPGSVNCTELIPWLAEELLASQERPFMFQLVGYLDANLPCSRLFI
jgi:hypothetical protein